MTDTNIEQPTPVPGSIVKTDIDKWGEYEILAGTADDSRWWVVKKTGANGSYQPFVIASSQITEVVRL